MGSMGLDQKKNERVRALAKQVLRDRFGENESDLSDALGVSPSTVNRFLSGKQGTSAEVAMALAKLAGVDIDVLLGSGPLPASQPVASPAPPPVSETHVSRAAARKMVRSCYDKNVHELEDADLVEDALLAGAPFMRDLDPTDYVRRLLDTATRLREKQQTIRPEDLHTATVKAAFEDSRDLRAQLARQREFEARARAWLSDNGIDPDKLPAPGQPKAPTLAPTSPTTPRPKSGAGRR